MAYKKPTIKVTSTTSTSATKSGTPRICGANTFHCNKFLCGDVYVCGSVF